MLYKGLRFISVIASIFGSSRAQDGFFSVSSGTSVVNCGNSTACTIECDTNGVEIKRDVTVYCNEAATCTFYCDPVYTNTQKCYRNLQVFVTSAQDIELDMTKQCVEKTMTLVSEDSSLTELTLSAFGANGFSGSSIDASGLPFGSSATFYVYADKTKAFEKTDIITPNNAHSHVSSIAGVQGALKAVTVTAGSNSYLTVECTGEKVCEKSVIDASDAEHLALIVGAGRDYQVGNGAVVTCPVSSSFTGSYGESCLIDASGGGELDTVTIHAVTGVQGDLWIADGNGNGAFSAITFTCDGGRESYTTNDPFDYNNPCWRGPTPEPSQSPTQRPTEATQSPTKQPTAAPTTRQPTAVPSKQPTKIPTKSPTKQLTDAPTDPTRAPTKTPTKQPTVQATNVPTRTPTRPTNGPTNGPTEAPTSAPTRQPSDGPTDAQSDAPTLSPSAAPTPRPIVVVRVSPTLTPTDRPTKTPVVDNDDDQGDDHGGDQAGEDTAETVMIMNLPARTFKILVISVGVVVVVFVVCGWAMYARYKSVTEDDGKRVVEMMHDRKGSETSEVVNIRVKKQTGYKGVQGETLKPMSLSSQKMLHSGVGDAYPQMHVMQSVPMQSIVSVHVNANVKTAISMQMARDEDEGGDDDQASSDDDDDVMIDDLVLSAKQTKGGNDQGVGGMQARKAADDLDDLLSGDEEVIGDDEEQHNRTKGGGDADSDDADVVYINGSNQAPAFERVNSDFGVMNDDIQTRR